VSVEIAEVVGIAGGSISVTSVVWFLVQRAIKKGDRAEERIVQDLRETLGKLETRMEKTEERMNGALNAHRIDIDKIRELATRTDERLQVREKRRGEPMTNPGHKRTPEQIAEAQRLYAENGDE
jgi:hypothetical protein